MTVTSQIHWGAMLYELRMKFAPYDFEQLQDAVLNMHPEDFRKMAMWTDADNPDGAPLISHYGFPIRVMGLLVSRTDLLPEGVLMLCNSRGEAIATVNIDTGDIRR